jgi:heme exporter protein D
VAAFVVFTHGPHVVGQKTPQDLVGGLHAAAAVVAQIQDQTLGALRVQLVESPVQVAQHLRAVRQRRARDDEVGQAHIADAARQQA